MAEKLQQQLKELGSKLERPPASKDAVVELLKKGASCLSELDQSPSKSIMEAMQPLMNAIAKPALLKHQDQEVKLFVASCACEITRITAPEAPYEDEVLKDIFHLIVSTLSGLRDIKDPSFGRRALVLETLATYRSCVLMLDLECDDLVHEIFNTCFDVISDEHPQNVLASMQKNLEVLLEESEDVPENLLLILLSAISHHKEEVNMAARRLAMNVIKNCAAKLEPGIKQFLVSSVSGHSRLLKSEINYHRVLYDICGCVPEILSGVISYLTGKLSSDQVDVRLKAVSLVGGLFALPGSTICEAFKPVFSKFLEKLTDRAVEVRMSVLEYVKNCLLENPFRAEAQQLISAVCDRLMDNDENVRKQVVSVVCDVACLTFTCIPVENIKLVSERLRDQSLLVKRYTVERLADIHRVSCMKQSNGGVKAGEYDWIVRKILRCFYDRDFRSDTIEPILSRSLIPDCISTKDKVTNWIRVFSGLDKVEVKVLEKILEQKQRLQQEMQTYLSLRQLFQEGDGAESQKKVTCCFRVMSSCFSHPSKAEEDFQTLNQLKDSKLWQILLQLVDPNTMCLQAITMQDELLNILGQKHQLYEFLRILSTKCSHSMLDKDHVKELLVEAGVQKSSGNTEAILACMSILLNLAQYCPLLFGGIEEDLAHLLENDNEIIKEGTLHILVKAGEAIRKEQGVSSRLLEPTLERLCMKGSRRQAKYAVHALASITKDDGLMSLSVLYKRLVNMLENKSQMPAVLQSLGCIAEVAMPVFETRESEVEKFIKEKILELRHITGRKATTWDDRSKLCSLKIFGIKALVKSYLPDKDAHLHSQISGLIRILKNMLLYGDISRETRLSLVDRAHLKLTAAKAVLRLSKHWENKIPVDVLYLAFQTSEDDFPEVRKLLFNKVYQCVRDQILDPKYTCAFLLDISSSQSDMEEYNFYLNDIIQKCWRRRGCQVSLRTDSISPQLYPEYILPYVIHSLAHHPSFPDIDECKDVKTYEPMYRKLYLFLSILVRGGVDGKSDACNNKDAESISLLTSIFGHIRHSEDAVDATKSKNSYALCNLGMQIIELLAPNQDDLQDSSATVTLPSMLYKPLEKKGENDLLVGEEKTWLSDEGILVHFESLDLQATRIVQSAILEDDVMDSETEGSEMPLEKLMKHLKASATRAEKDKNEPAQAGSSSEEDFDTLKMDEDVKSDDLDSTKKFDKCTVYVRRKRSSHELQKSKMLLSEATDAPVPKRRRTSLSEKSPSEVGSKDSERPQNANEENINVDSDKMDEEGQTSSASQSEEEETDEGSDFQILSSRMRKRKRSSSSLKQKGKRSDGGRITLKNSSEVKKGKKASNSDSTHSMSSSKLGSVKKQKPKTATGLGECTTKDNGGFGEELVGCRIKVWWPLDKQYYEGLVKSFNTQKKKHVILYDDGDVEVLQLERECWELLDKAPKASSSSKGSLPKEESSEQGRRSTRGPRQDEKSEQKLPSQKKKKGTPQISLKQEPKIMSKSKSSKKGGGSPDISCTDPTSNSSSDESDSEKKEKNKNIDKSEELSGEEYNLDKEAKNVSIDAQVPEDDKMESQDIEKYVDHGSDSEANSCSEKMKPNESKREAVPAQEGGSKVKKGGKRGKKTPVRKKLAENQPLSTWKRRSAKK